MTTDYWETTVKDLYVRGVDANSVENAPREDFNNQVENDGKDWFVFAQDEEREDGDGLCTADDATVYACKKIRCILRRRMQNSDPDDMQFAPSGNAGDNTMGIPAYKSYIQVN